MFIYWIAAFLFRKYRTVKSLTTGLMLGTITMAYYECIKLHHHIPGVHLVLNSPAMSSEAIRTTVVTAILPFNLIKGIVVTIVFVALFSRLKVWVFAK